MTKPYQPSAPVSGVAHAPGGPFRVGASESDERIRCAGIVLAAIEQLEADGRDNFGRYDYEVSLLRDIHTKICAEPDPQGRPASAVSARDGLAVPEHVEPPAQGEPNAERLQQELLEVRTKLETMAEYASRTAGELQEARKEIERLRHHEGILEEAGPQCGTPV